jgi:glycosyltransferase involved in cell wall biosynthesis
MLVGLKPEQSKVLPSQIIAVPLTNCVAELASYYSAADVLMNLSYQETFGMTTVEAFSCGTPAIVYNTTASPELVSPDTGIVVELRDIEGVLAAVNKIKAIGKPYFSDACRKRAEELYDKNTNYKLYLQLFERLT